MEEKEKVVVFFSGGGARVLGLSGIVLEVASSWWEFG